MKFIHAADIHLDSPLHRLETYEGAPVDEIRHASRRAFENLVALALAESVDLVLIAGDLFDGDWKDYNTGLFLVHQLSRLAQADIPVAIVSGNHDAAGRLTTELPYPANVTLFSHQRPETLVLEGPRIAIHGQSFAKQVVSENLAATYPAPRSGYFNIGLLHTSLTGRPGHEAYAPCAVEELIAKGYDYWALGHVHRFEIVAASPPIVFSGCLQGRHIRETGPKGCVLVHVFETGAVQVEPRALDVARWEQIAVDVSACTSLDHCLAEWQSRLRTMLLAHGSLPVMVRVVFVGGGAVHPLLQGNPDQCKQAVRAAALAIGGEQVWVEKVVLATHAKEPGAGADPGGALPEIRRFVQSLRADPTAAADFVQRQMGELTRRLPPEVRLADDPGALDDLFEQAQAMLAQRLQNQETPP